MTITLATLATATAQEVFNQVARHLLTQMEKSENENESACLYRGPNNLACAAGCLIADDEYDPAMENVQWSGLITDKVVPENHFELIQELQDIHDYFYPDSWFRKLDELAASRNLDKSVLQ